jgi:hypothetical protein
MLAFFSILALVSSVFASEVVDYWPKGLVPLETRHAKIIFATDQVKSEEVGVELKSSPLKVSGINLKNCRWDTRRLLHCKFASSLSADTSYELSSGTFKGKFQTIGLFLADYRETLTDKKFRLQLNFSQKIPKQQLKLAVRCEGNPIQHFVGELTEKGQFSLPIVAPTDRVCGFMFPEGVKSANGAAHKVPGEWLLRAGLPLPSQDEQYYVALRGLSCGHASKWDVVQEMQKGVTMPIITCTYGETLRLTLAENTHPVGLSLGQDKLVKDQWGYYSLVIPNTAPASFTVMARDPKKPHLSTGYIVRVMPPELRDAPYAELVDDKAYLESTKPYLTQLNHRATPLVEIAAKRLDDADDILQAVKVPGYSYERRKPLRDMPEGQTFSLAVDGSEGFKSGIDLARLKDFGAGIWWVQSVVSTPALSNEESQFEGESADRTSVAVLQFSDIGLHVKRGLKGSLVWAFRLSSGKPLSDAEIFISQKDSAVSVGETNKDGTLFVPQEKILEEEGVVIARKKDEWVALPLNYMTSSGISSWDYGYGGLTLADLEWAFDAIPSNPLLRPGESGAVKIFARKSGLKGPEMAELKATPFELLDPRGEKIAHGNLDFNSYGTAMLDFKLKADAATGKYQLKINNGVVLEPFSVEVFTTPTLKISVDQLVKTRAPLNVTGLAEFMVGGGVQNAKGEAMLVVRTLRFNPPSSSPYAHFDFADYNTYSSTDLMGQVSFVTDKEGRFKANFDRLDLPDYGTLIAEATVTDGDGMTISGRTEKAVSKRGWFAGANLEGYVVERGQSAKPQAVVLDTEGKPLAGVKLRFSMKRRTWNTVRRLGSGNVYYYDSELKEENAGSCEVVSTLASVGCDLPVKDEGSYLITLSSSHKGQTGSERQMHFWVPGPNSWAWAPRHNHDRIDVKPEKTSYEFGEKARFLVQSPYAEGEALVTVERYGVIRHEVVKFKGGFWTYELPLEDSAYVPGVYVSVVLLKGRTGEKFEGGVDLGRPSFKMGYAQIQVAKTPTILKVTAATEKRYSPRDEVEVKLNVKDWKDRKVDGELAVTVVDDAVLQLVPNYRSFFEVMDTFYHVKGLGVWNYQTLTRLIGRRSFGKKGAVAGGGGGDSVADVRANFKSVAHWEPALKVEDGVARFKFKLPDNLTTWRVIAVAVDDKNRFGEGETTFKAVLPLMLTPFFPPFLRVGDQFTAAFGVQNATENKVSAALTAKLTNLNPETVEMEREVATGVRELLNFDFKTVNAGPAVVEARVKAGKDQDAVRISVPIKPDEGVRHVSGELIPLSGVQSLDFSTNQKALPGSIKLRVYFTKSLLDGLDEAFRYVVHYPYGCWEQKTTGALFLTEYKEMEPYLAEFKFDEKQGDARKSIQNYLDSASDYQRADGSMGYYPGDYQGDPYLTVFTGHAFGVYKKAGFTIAPTVEEKLKNRLLAMKDHEGSMGSFTEFKDSMQAFIASILVELKDAQGAKLAAKLYPRRSKMDLFGQGMLLKALPVGSKEANALKEELLKKAKSQGSSVSFTEKMPDTAKHWLYSERRGQCVIVDALLGHGVNEALAAKMVHGLTPDKRTARWGNTQENYFCFQTFRHYARLFESTAKSGEIAWSMGPDSKTIAVKRLEQPKIEYEEAALKANPKARAELKSGEKAYIHTRLMWSTSGADAVATASGFALEKNVAVKRGNAWVPLTGKVWTVKKGEQVRVTLNIRGSHDRYKVGVSDPIPAGWRAINPRLATSSLAALVAAGVDGESEAREEYDWWDWDVRDGFGASDMRESAVQFFADYLDAGKNYRLEYLAQVTTEGEFALPATIVEEMYNEEIRATTGAVRVRVTE